MVQSTIFKKAIYIIDKLFHTDAEPAVSVESPEVKEEHKVDPDEFALYKKYL